MSKPLLHQLYDGEIFPAEDVNPKNPKYRELCRKVSEEREYFHKKFSENDRERFDAMDILYQGITTIYGYEDFSYGFRLGVGLMVEALINGGEYPQNDEPLHKFFSEHNCFNFQFFT